MLRTSFDRQPDIVNGPDGFRFRGRFSGHLFCDRKFEVWVADWKLTSCGTRGRRPKDRREQPTTGHTYRYIHHVRREDVKPITKEGHHPCPQETFTVENNDSIPVRGGQGFAKGEA